MNLSRRALLGGSAAAAFGLAAGGARGQNLPYALKPNKPFAGTTIRVMLPNAGQYRAQKKRLGEFENLTGIEVQYGYVPYGQLLDKFTAEAVAGSSDYDLVTYQDTWGPSLATFLEPLDALVRADAVDLASYASVFVDCSTYKNTLYGLPVRGQAQLLFYRKDLFEQAGITPPATMDELMQAGEAVQKATEVSGVAMDYGKGNGFQNLFSWMNFMYGHEAELLDAGGQVAFNSDAGVAATTAYLGPLLERKIANPGSVQFVEGDKVSSFAQGNAAMVMVWWWAYSVLVGERSTLKPEQVGFVTVPGFGNGTRSNIGQCMPFGISRLSSKKDAAWEVLKWMANPDLEVAVATDKSDPDTNEIIVVHKSSLENERVNAANDGLQAAGYESLKASRPMPLLKTWPQAASVLEATISDLAAGNGSVKDELDAAAARIQRIVARNPE